MEFPEFAFGYPLPTFYPPLYYLLTAFVQLGLDLDPYASAKIVLTGSFFLSACLMYTISRKAGFPRAAAIIAGVAYISSGYYLRNVIAQGVFPAALAFLVTPCVFGLYHLAIVRKTIFFGILSGISLGAALLSHLLSGALLFLFFVMIVLTDLVPSLASRDLGILVRKIGTFLVSTVIASLLVAWFYVPGILRYSKYIYMFHGTIGTEAEPVFPMDPLIFAERNVPFAEFFIRRPLDFAGGALLPYYMGSAMSILAILAILRFLFGNVAGHERGRVLNAGKNHLVFLSVVLLVLTVAFASYIQLFLVPLGLIGKQYVIYLMKLQQPGRAAFLMPYALAVLASYAVAGLSEQGWKERFEQFKRRTNLDLDLSKIIVLILILVMVFDTIGYAASPFHYSATYPPYGSSGLDEAYRWLSSQGGYFRVVDTLGQVHNHLMIWDDLAFIQTPPGDPAFLPYSNGTVRTFIAALQPPQTNLELSGYFGVKYAIGHLADAHVDAAGFANTSWIPIRQFTEIYVFENPFYSPPVEVRSDPNNINASSAGEAEISSYTAAEFQIKATAHTPGSLVFKFFSFPRWTAYVNGHAVPILENSWGFMYIPLEPGTYNVVFTYGQAEKSETMSLLIGPILVVVVTVFATVRWRRTLAKPD